MYPRITIAVLAVVACSSTGTFAFTPLLQSHKAITTNSQNHESSFRAGVQCRMATGDSDGNAVLNFGVAVDLSSAPLPNGTTAEDVRSFFEQPETKRSLLDAGGTRTVEEVTMTPALEALWKEARAKDYGDEMLPSSGDAILVTDTSTQFPGLKMTNQVYNAVKLLPAKDETEMPKYAFLLVGEKRSVSGLPPVVWVFNKLTGAEKQKGGEDAVQPASGVAFSDITVKDSNGSLVFNFVADIRIQVKFPATLLKILPTNKEKAEASGSSAIQKTIEKDVEKGVKGARDAFLKYLSSR